MKFVTAQPDSNYYLWQLSVQLNNFRKFGIEDKTIILLGYNPKLGINPKALEFSEKTRATVLFYPDTRNLSHKMYQPSIKPHLMKQLYEKNNDLVAEQNYLYLDSDVIFIDFPNFKDLNLEKCLHVSDTKSYIGVAYIKSKSEMLFNEMCKVVGIHPSRVEKNDNECGGAQYLFKHFNYLTPDFWEKVENDSVALYVMMLVTSNKYSPEAPIQSWTAEMWSTLWNLWLIGYDTKITDELSFCWATSPIEEWSTTKMYHNAGVTSDRKDLFNKGNFIDRAPYQQDFSYVNEKYCSIKYTEEIIETAEKLKLRN